MFGILGMAKCSVLLVRKSMKHLLKHLLLELLLLVVVVRGEHEAGHNIYRDWEDYGAVVLCRNAIQGLKIP